VTSDGHCALHVGVAVKACLSPEFKVGFRGLTATEVSVTTGGVTVTVMTVEASLVVPLRLALTNIPTVPATDPAAKLTELPDPEMEPSELLEIAHR